MENANKPAGAKFYYNGHYFDTYEDMMDFANKWPEMPLDLENFMQILMQRYREAALNKQTNPNFSNAMAMRLLRMSTDGFAD